MEKDELVAFFLWSDNLVLGIVLLCAVLFLVITSILVLRVIDCYRRPRRE
jgi:hypothetical protein